LVCLLGGFRLLYGGKPLQIGGKGAALLTVLATRASGGVPREAILATLWPDQDPRLAGGSLNTLVWSLYRRLAPEVGTAHVVLCKDGEYSLNTRSSVAVDWVLFDGLADAGDAHARCGDLQAAVRLYQHAIALYQGDLYAGPDGEAELVIERERLRVRLQGLLTDLAQWSHDRGDTVACLSAAQRVLSVDPFREDMHRLLMHCYVRRGHRSQALRQYQVCSALLRSEFDATPESATRELFDRIRTGHVSTSIEI
jgi:DNA-binding SARP family transcriptional activator